MKSRTDRDRLTSRSEKVCPTEQQPEFDPSHVVRGIVRCGLKPVASKGLVSLRIDQDVIEWLEAQGPGCQTRINLMLCASRDACAG